VERLARNKEKLADARRLYEDHVQELCAVIEEVTDRGWKNMVPILVKLGQSDQHLAMMEDKLMSKLDLVVSAIKQAGQGTQMDPEEVGMAIPLNSVAQDTPLVGIPPSTLPPLPPPDEPTGNQEEQLEETVPNMEAEQVKEDEPVYGKTTETEDLVDVSEEETTGTAPSSQPDTLTTTTDSGSNQGDPWNFRNLAGANEEALGDQDVGTSFSPRSYMYWVDGFIRIGVKSILTGYSFLMMALVGGFL
jgi:hypothetical protein